MGSIHEDEDEGATDAQVLVSASRVGLASVVSAMLDSGADPDLFCPAGLTPMMHAAQGGRVEALGALIAAGASLELADAHGVTALGRAASAGRVECVRMLLGAGAASEAPAARGSALGTMFQGSGYPDLDLIRELLTQAWCAREASQIESGLPERSNEPELRRPPSL